MSWTSPSIALSMLIGLGLDYDIFYTEKVTHAFAHTLRTRLRTGAHLCGTRVASSEQNWRVHARAHLTCARARVCVCGFVAARVLSSGVPFIFHSWARKKRHD